MQHLFCCVVRKMSKVVVPDVRYTNFDKQAKCRSLIFFIMMKVWVKPWNIKQNEIIITFLLLLTLFRSHNIANQFLIKLLSLINNIPAETRCQVRVKRIANDMSEVVIWRVYWSQTLIESVISSDSKGLQWWRPRSNHEIES